MRGNDFSVVAYKWEWVESWCQTSSETSVSSPLSREHTVEDLGRPRMCVCGDRSCWSGESNGKFSFSTLSGAGIVYSFLHEERGLCNVLDGDTWHMMTLKII